MSSAHLRTPITTEEEREQALRDYKLTIEYKHLKQHSPSGVYLLPSLNSLRLFHGIIFVRRGLYSNAIFKFTMDLPEQYNSVDSFPRIHFTSNVYNPHVNPKTGALDIQSAYPTWDPHRHYLVTVLTYLKKIFYIKSYGDEATYNIDARELSRTNPLEYRKNVEKCVLESQRSVFWNTEPESLLKLKEENECHLALKELLRDMDPCVNGEEGKSLQEEDEDKKIVVTVTRDAILQCVDKAQKIGMERMEVASERK